MSGVSFVVFFATMIGTNDTNVSLANTTYSESYSEAREQAWASREAVQPEEAAQARERAVEQARAHAAAEAAVRAQLDREREEATVAMEALALQTDTLRMRTTRLVGRAAHAPLHVDVCACRFV